VNKVTVPNIDVNEDSATIVDIYIENGEKVQKEDIICSIETTKVVEDISANFPGYLFFPKKIGDRVKYNEVLFYIRDTIEEKIDIKENNAKKDFTIINKLTNKAKKFIEDHEIDITKFADSLQNYNNIKVSDIEKIIHSKNNYNYDNYVKRILIIGAGTSGEVVADILLDNPKYRIVGFVDDSPLENFSFYNIPIIANNIRSIVEPEIRKMFDAVVISFGGDLNKKHDIFLELKESGISFINAIDKTAKIGRNVSLGFGNVIGANTYIGTSTAIGDNNWIASSVNIDHHNRVGSSNLFGPGFVSPGKVEIGSKNMFGANSSLSNKVIIGNHNTIMNNIAVYKNIEDDQVIK
jgi:acetyltransferase-like isoleucine patch superfamily enzyme